MVYLLQVVLVRGGRNADGVQIWSAALLDSLRTLMLLACLWRSILDLLYDI